MPKTDTQTAPKAPTKSAQIRALLSRKQGASLEALCEVTGWQPHTTRAALSRLRKQGVDLTRTPGKDGGPAIYKAASPSKVAPAPKATS